MTMAFPPYLSGRSSPKSKPFGHRRRAAAALRHPHVLVAALALAAPTSAWAQASDQGKAHSTAVEFASLQILREKGIISQTEYERALSDLGPTAGLKATDSMTLVFGSVATTLYGSIEAHGIYDTTQSFPDSPNNAQVARPDTYAGEHTRMQFSARNTRFGFRFQGPDIGSSIHTSANLEMDFFAPSQTTNEAMSVESPPIRFRLANFKIETPIVDVLIGHYWDVFGWQPFYLVPSVQYAGVPANLFGRTPQLRLSKKVRIGDSATVESAIAALRPPQRDAGVPEGQAGLRLSLDKWTGLQTFVSTTKLISPASIAVTGTVRKFSVKEFSANPISDNTMIGKGLAVSAFIPILPATKDDKRHGSFALHGQFVTGEGIADLFTGLVGGVENPPLPNPNGVTPAPTYTSNIDPGLAVYDAKGDLQLVQWTTFIVGAQFYVPGTDGRIWIAGSYAHSSSSNASELGNPEKVRENEDWFNVGAWVDPLRPVRFGIEYSNYNDEYADGESAVNHRGEMCAFWFF